MTPSLSATDPRQKIVDSLVGLPFAALGFARTGFRDVVVGEVPDGSKFRIGDVEDVWNMALLIDSFDGPGAFRKGCAPGALVVLAEAERRYGCTIEQGLPRWLAMPRTTYDRWEDRPRVAWHGKVLA